MKQFVFFANNTYLLIYLGICLNCSVVGHIRETECHLVPQEKYEFNQLSWGRD